jgi:FlaA1/EpsC-like NDP-sugar epimerase
MSLGGEVFLLNMGKPIKILNLAEDLIRLSGFEPGQDIEIVFTGLHTGEKLTEVLWDEGVDYHATDHPEITRLDRVEMLDPMTLVEVVDRLLESARKGDVDRLVQILEDSIPGAEIGEIPAQDVTSFIY